MATKKEMSFEKAISRLEEIVSILETGECSLDDSIKLFEEGTKLTACCSDMLKTAEQKILELTASGIEDEKEHSKGAGLDG